MNRLQQLTEAEQRIVAARVEQVQALAAYRQHLTAHLADIEQQIKAIEAGQKPEAPEFDLTEREKQVIRCLIHGITTGNKIAEALGCSERTIRTHIHNVIEKTDIRSRAELAVRFKEWWS